MKTVLKIVLPLLVLAAGVLAARHLMTTKPPVKKKDVPETSMPVEVVSVMPSKQLVSVRAKGTVVAARTVVVMPEVSGRLVELHPQLVKGGRVSAGDRLVRIDARDYELAVAQQRAAISNAQFGLKVERGREKVAKREWKLFEEDIVTTPSGRDLALRKPHIANARAALAASRSGLARAELSVERTTITAPFNGLVIEEAVEPSQLVGPQSRLATIVGTDEFWVETAVPLDRLAWIRIPGVNGSVGSTARVLLEAGPGEFVERPGRVVRLLADIEPTGRMARVVVAVDDPLVTSSAAPLPLLLGAYVDVAIDGRPLGNVYELPRLALRDGDQVWLLDDQSQLAIQHVGVAWRRTETVLVSSGLTPGARVVVSALSAPVAGMKLRDVNAKEAAPEPPQPVAEPTASAPATEAVR